MGVSAILPLGRETPGFCPVRRLKGEGSYSGSSSYGGGYRGQREMYSVICSQCGKEAQVPFQPRGDKPVYCSDCFRSQRPSGGGYAGSSRGGSRRDDYGGRGYGSRY